MRRSGLIGVAVLGLAVGTGCRSNCYDRCGLVGRADLASRIGCREPARAVCAPGVPASIGHPVSVTPDGALPPAGWVPDAGFGYPTYPGGEPMPLGPGTVSPPNELPYPSIPAPGVPESPPAQPIPAIPAATTSFPGSSAYTPGEARRPK